MISFRKFKLRKAFLPPLILVLHRTDTHLLVSPHFPRLILHILTLRSDVNFGTDAP